MKLTVGLLRHHDVRCLWAADAVSQFGTRISLLAVPLLAISALHASTFQVALLRAAGSLAFLLLGLPAGAWCDRMRRRPVLVTADLARALLLFSVPVAAVVGALSLWQLYTVAFFGGVCGVFFDVAHRSYLPRLVAADELVEANARLAGNMAVAAVAGPTLAGYLIQWLTAPVAVLADAVSYLCSAAWLRSIRAAEPHSERTERRQLTREIGSGLRFAVSHPVLRAVTWYGTTAMACQAAFDAVLLVFLVREVHLSAGAIGLLSTVSLLGSVVASMLARRIGARLGPARTLWTFALAKGAAFLLFPLTGNGWRLGFYVIAGVLSSFAIIVGWITQAVCVQALCPADLLARVTATTSFALWGAVPLGSLGGGVLGSTVGLRSTLWVAATGVLLSAGWLVCSPLRCARDLPTGTRVGSPAATTTGPSTAA